MVERGKGEVIFEMGGSDWRMEGKHFYIELGLGSKREELGSYRFLQSVTTNQATITEVR